MIQFTQILISETLNSCHWLLCASERKKVSTKSTRREEKLSSCTIIPYVALHGVPGNSVTWLIIIVKPHQDSKAMNESEKTTKKTAQETLKLEYKRRAKLMSKTELILLQRNRWNGAEC